MVTRTSRGCRRHVSQCVCQQFSRHARLHARRIASELACESWLNRHGALAAHQQMIAVEVGYVSEAALSRAFKAQSGVAPRMATSAGAAGDRLIRNRIEKKPAASVP